MFAKAYKIVSGFTHPVVISTRGYDNTVTCGLASFIILNKEGWILTVAHLFNSYFLQKKHTKEIQNYEQQIKKIRDDKKLEIKQRKKMLKKVKPNPKWITNLSYWWGKDGVQIKNVKILAKSDIAIGRLEPYDPNMVKTYPVIKNPNVNMNPGTSLCRIGYPFYEMKATYNSQSDRFNIPKNMFPIPRFPIEGIYTRNILGGKDSKYDVKFLETSSPGLKGQSGGPIFDAKGTVWAIQSRTAHLPLGFSPKVRKGEKEIEENQFLNVGLGVHPEVITAFLTDNGINFNLSSY